MQMFKCIKYRLRFIMKLIPFSAGVKHFFIFNLILSVIGLFLSFLTPVFYKMFIEKVILQGKIHALLTVVIGYLLINGANILISYIKNYNKNRLINRITFRVKFKFWRYLLKQEFTQFEKQNIGDVKMRLEDDTNSISPFSGYQTIDYLIAYITVFISALLLFSIEWRLAVFSVVVIPITFYFDNIISKKEKALNNELRTKDQDMSAWLHASIHGWREVKALNLQRHEKLTFIKFIHIRGIAYARWINYWTIRVLILPRIRDDFFMQFGLYFLGGLLIILGGFKIGDLLVFAMYYSMLSDAVKTVSTTDADLQSSIPFTDRLLDIIDKARVKSRRGISPENSNEIVLDNVCFAYQGSKQEILYNFSMSIHKGERVAITGKSGSGKTTILKLITGMVEPTCGRVLFSDVDLNHIDLKEMHKRIGFVMQENTLFNTTIKENLLYGNSKATDEALISACRKAYIYDFIKGLPDGMDTVIGERGLKLSGGQRQRIVLARLFLRDVDIFIFDEATSALDQYSENIIHDAIRNIAEDKTIIVVAHRQSSISLCDRKIVLS